MLAGESTSLSMRSSAAWRFVEDTIRDVMRRYNYEEIRTPILEDTALIARGVGQLTDIVSKEMFAFTREETNYVLRPEITAPVMRAYLQHHLDQRGGVQKLYYVGPCFRAERPQKGRYRQFHQFGVETIVTVAVSPMSCNSANPHTSPRAYQVFFCGKVRSCHAMNGVCAGRCLPAAPETTCTSGGRFRYSLPARRQSSLCSSSV